MGWREILEKSRQIDPSSSNAKGVLMFVESGGYRLELQSEVGEYSAFARAPQDAWERLSRITGRSVEELKRLQLTRV